MGIKSLRTTLTSLQSQHAKRWGQLTFTVGYDSAGNWNTSDVMAFLRNAGGIGSGGYVLCFDSFLYLMLTVTYIYKTRVNTVDVIYAASTIYLYLNPKILGYLLRLLLEYQESSMYTNLYAAIHIGEVQYKHG